MLVDGEARGELDFAFCTCSRCFPGGRELEVKEDNITVVVAAIGNNVMENAPLCITFVP